MINHCWILTLLPEWSKSYLFHYLIFIHISSHVSLLFLLSVSLFQDLCWGFCFILSWFFLAKWEIRNQFLDQFSQHHLLKFSLWCEFWASLLKSGLLWYLYLHLLFYSKTHMSVFMQVSCFYYLWLSSISRNQV